MKLSKIKYLMIVVITLLSLFLIHNHFNSNNNKNNIYEIRYNDNYLCSGFPIYQEKDYTIIATCSHIFRDDKYFVSFDNIFIGNTNAKIIDIYTSPNHDVSLLKVINYKFKVSKSRKVKKGDKCISYGYIDNNILNIADGYILDERIYQNSENKCDKLIIHNAKTYQGMSGGPLYSGNNIVGLNVGNNINQVDLSYAINIDVVLSILKDYLNETKNPWDGVKILDNQKIDTTNCINISYEVRNKINRCKINSINKNKIENNKDLYNELIVNYKNEYEIEYIDKNKEMNTIHIYRIIGE